MAMLACEFSYHTDAYDMTIFICHAMPLSVTKSFFSKILVKILAFLIKIKINLCSILISCFFYKIFTICVMM